jgi:hypothetical protein
VEKLSKLVPLALSVLALAGALYAGLTYAVKADEAIGKVPELEPIVIEQRIIAEALCAAGAIEDPEVCLALGVAPPPKEDDEDE